MTTKLIDMVPPTRAERKRGAEVVFRRRVGRRIERIKAARCHEGWEQWGTTKHVLADNVPDVRRWRTCFFAEEA